MSDAVQQIKDRLSILDVVSPYVELHKAGKNFKGKSPFTNEKTPSFYVSPDRGMYYCFSTNQGGDMFTFIQTMEGVDFKEALRILAEKARVELTPVSAAKQTQRERWYALLETVTMFYVNQLRQNEMAMTYLKERGVLADTIASWRIGYAPGPPTAGWRTTREYLLSKGFSEAELAQVGLTKTAEDGKEPYDVFRNRIMFPLFDQGGRVVAFSGRTLDKGPDVPKYVNSPETELYKKSELLYGYDRAKSGIRQMDFSLLVEGQFDVVMSHQAGYRNTVAVSGTALTQFHVQLLERLSPKVVLALDADKAGVSAAKRAADIMLRRGMDVKVARLQMKDPADLVREDPKLFKNAVGSSGHIIEWLLEQLLALDLAPRVLKLRAREEVLPFIAILSNKIDQEHFEQVVAAALGTTAAAVHYEVERLLETSSKAEAMMIKSPNVIKADTTQPEAETKTRVDKLQTYLISVRSLFPETTAKRLGEAVAEIMGCSVAEMEANLSSVVQAEVIFRAEAESITRSRIVFESEVLNALNHLRLLMAKRKMTVAKLTMQEAELEGDETKIAAALKLVEQAQQTLRQPDYELSWLVGGEK